MWYFRRLVMCHVVSIVVVHDDDGLVDRGEKEKSKGTDDVPVRSSIGYVCPSIPHPRSSTTVTRTRSI
jgi:hypothetical protein